MKSLMLIDLDAILDTRVGSLFELDPEEAVSILNKGWRTRTSDDLTPYTSKITNEEFKEAYENRTKQTLALSRPTNILKRIAPQILRLVLESAKSNSRLEDYCLVINVHPYVLSDVESKQIQMAVAEIIGEHTPIRIASYLPESTRLTYLEMRGFTDYITYDIQGWIEREFKDINKPEEFVSMPEISIWGPSLTLTKGALETVIEEEPDLTVKDDPWDFLKIAFAPFVNINWIDVEDLSLLSMSA